MHNSSCFAHHEAAHPRLVEQTVGLHLQRNVDYSVKSMNVLSKPMNFALQPMNVVLKSMIFALKSMDSVLK